MAATLSSSGTWTTLATDVSPFRMAAQTTTAAGQASMNVPVLSNISGSDYFSTSAVRNNVPTEAFQIIELIMRGYGTANNALAFWPAASLLRTWINGIFDGQVATTPMATASPTTFPA